MERSELVKKTIGNANRIRAMYLDEAFIDPHPTDSVLCVVTLSDLKKYEANIGHFIIAKHNSQYDIRWICAGYSFSSADGEFRSGFMHDTKFKYFERLTNILLQYYNDYRDITIDDVVQDVLIKNGLHMSKTPFYPKELEKKEVGEAFKQLSKRKPENIIFLLNILTYQIQKYCNVLPKHINEDYVNMIDRVNFDNLSEYKLFNINEIVAYDAKLKSNSKQELNINQHFLNYINILEMFALAPTSNLRMDLETNLLKVDAKGELTKMQITPSNDIFKNVSVVDSLAVYGIKLSPMSYSEVIDPFNVTLGAWKEWIISRRINDLIFQNISQGFSFCKNFMYVKNNRPKLFDNKSQYDKLNFSHVARQIIIGLENSKQVTNLVHSFNSIETEKKQIAGDWIKSRFNKVYDDIEQIEDFIKKYVIMSEVAFAFIVEVTGRTFANEIQTFETGNFVPFTRYSTHFNDSSLSEVFTENGIKQYIFEILYNILCISSIGIIHSDLHLNNILVTHNHTTSDDLTYKKKIMYKLRKNNYVFDRNYNNCVFIDFSRAIILPDKLHNFYPNDLVNTEGIHIPKEAFEVTQAKYDTFATQIADFWVYNYDELINKYTLIVTSVKNYPEVAFKVSSVLDALVCINNVSAALKNHTPELYKVIQPFLSTLITSLSSTFAQLVNDLFYNPTSMSITESPIIAIIHKFFINNLTEQEPNEYTLFEFKQLDTDNLFDKIGVEAACKLNTTFAAYKTNILDKFMIANQNLVNTVGGNTLNAVVNHSTTKQQNDLTNAIDMIQFIALRHKSKAY